MRLRPHLLLPARIFRPHRRRENEHREYTDTNIRYLLHTSSCYVISRWKHAGEQRWLYPRLGHTDIALSLIDLDADIEGKDENGDTPLVYACWFFKLDTATRRRHPVRVLPLDQSCLPRMLGSASSHPTAPNDASLVRQWIYRLFLAETERGEFSTLQLVDARDGAVDMSGQMRPEHGPFVVDQCV